MGTVSRVHTFSSGAILTAAQLNNEFDNLLTSSAINGGLDATNLGVTAGQATASKALVVDGSRNLADGTAGNRINNLALSGTFESTGGVTATAGITSGSNIVSDTDSTDDLGTTSVRWANLYADSIGDSGQALAVKATTLSFDAASTIDTSGNNNLTLDAGTATLTLDANTIESDASTLSFDAAVSIDTSGNNNLSLDAGTATLTLDAGTIESDAGTLSFDGAASIDTSGNNALAISTGSANLNVTAATLALTGAQTISGNLTVDTSTLVVDSSNNRVGIGHTAPDVLLHASAGGSDTSSLAGNTQAIFANTAASDSISRVAIIAGATTGFSVLDFGDTGASNSGGITYAHQHDRMSFGASGGTTRASIDSDGLKFGTDTAAANALDDYEEGTWTPTANEGSLSVYSARYTKIGNVITVAFYLHSISPPDNANAFQINGLPYNSSSAAAFYHSGQIGYSGAAQMDDMGLIVQRNDDGFYFHFLNSTNSGGQVKNSQFVSRSITTFIAQFTYTTD